MIKQRATLIESVEDIMEALGNIGRQLQKHVSNATVKAAAKAEQTLFDTARLKLSDAEKKIYDFFRIRLPFLSFTI